MPEDRWPTLRAIDEEAKSLVGMLASSTGIPGTMQRLARVADAPVEAYTDGPGSLWEVSIDDGAVLTNGRDLRTALRRAIWRWAAEKRLRLRVRRQEDRRSE